jgi:hypothetical protein
MREQVIPDEWEIRYRSIHHDRLGHISELGNDEVTLPHPFFSVIFSSNFAGTSVHQEGHSIT